MMYFDASATTPLDSRVKEEIILNMDIWGNENSKHKEGFKSREKIDECLFRIGKVLGVSADQLAPTYSGTDSNRKLIWACRKRFGYENLFASAVEHSSVRDEILESNLFDPRKIDEIPGSAKFIALMQANSETGALYDLLKLREKFPKAVILSDFSQAFPKGILPDFENCDGGTFAPQKFYGPKGVGLLYLKNPELFTEISKDSHTKNVFLIAGMAKAFELFAEERAQIEAQMIKYQNQIESFLAANIPDYKIHEVDYARVSGLINVAFKDVRGSELMAILSDQEGICISTGSACTSDLMSPTPVISFIEKNSMWQYPIRISLHKFLTDSDVSDFCEILQHYIEMLRKRGF